MSKPIYFDYHATTPCDENVIAAMLPYFSEQFGNPHASLNKHGRRAADAVNTAKEQIGALLNAPASSFTLTSGATEANNIALLGQHIEDDNRTEILISALEHDSVWNCIPALENKGFTVQEIPSNAQGIITSETLENLINDKTKLVSVMTVNHEIGTIQPISDLAKIAHAHGAVFHTDAAQAVGKIPLDITKMNIDLLSFSGHKCYGPMGVGALYTRNTPPIALHPISCGGNQQKLRSGTIALPLAVGLGKAASIAQNRLSDDQTHLRALTKTLSDKITKQNPDIHWNGILDHRIPGSLNFILPNTSAEDMLLSCLDSISLSTGSACGTGRNKPSRILQAIGLSDHDIHHSIRLSMGRHTTQDDIDILFEKLIPYLN